MQKEYIYPALGNRMSPKEWNEAGRPDIIERADGAQARNPLDLLSRTHRRGRSTRSSARNHDIKLPRAMMEPGDPRWAS